MFKFIVSVKNNFFWLSRNNLPSFAVVKGVNTIGNSTQYIDQKRKMQNNASLSPYNEQRIIRCNLWFWLCIYRTTAQGLSIFTARRVEQNFNPGEGINFKITQETPKLLWFYLAKAGRPYRSLQRRHCKRATIKTEIIT